MLSRERVKKFIEDWIADNVLATGYQPEGDSSEAHRLAEACWLAAYKVGIRRRSIEEAVGLLVDHITMAMKTANDAETARRHAKGD